MGVQSNSLNNGFQYFDEIMQYLESQMDGQTDIFQMLAGWINTASGAQDDFNKGQDGNFTSADAQDMMNKLNSIVSDAQTAYNNGQISASDLSKITSQVQSIKNNIAGANSLPPNYDEMASDVNNTWAKEATDPDAQKKMQNITNGFSSLSSQFSSINSITQAEYQADSQMLTSFEGAYSNLSTSLINVMQTCNQNMSSQ
jgi:hypothetical protein